MIKLRMAASFCVHEWKIRNVLLINWNNHFKGRSFLFFDNRYVLLMSCEYVLWICLMNISLAFSLQRLVFWCISYILWYYYKYLRQDFSVVYVALWTDEIKSIILHVFRQTGKLIPYASKPLKWRMRMSVFRRDI